MSTRTRQPPVSYSPQPAAARHNYIRNAVEVRDRRLRRHDHRVSGRRSGSDRRDLRADLPRLFKPIARCRPRSREHVRYPEDLFAIQARCSRRIT
jgi:uncharacterized membrane protein (UPF0182 family)